MAPENGVAWINPGDSLEAAMDIRMKVFCEEQGYDPALEFDATDALAYHILLYHGGFAAATGRIYSGENGEMHLGRIAVLKEKRGLGLGLELVKEMTKKARELGAKTALLDAQSYAVPFYERAGYSPCGAEHMDGHIPHTPMQIRL